MTTPGDLLTVASFVAGFAGNVLVFRLQRELGNELVDQHGVATSWIPWADRMLFASVMLLLLGAAVPILVFPALTLALPRAACSAGMVLTAFYIPTIIVHYRRYFWRPLTRDTLTEDAVEQSVVIVAVLLAVIAFLLALAGTAQPADQCLISSPCLETSRTRR